jgi:hypothetical protein
VCIEFEAGAILARSSLCVDSAIDRANSGGYNPWFPGEMAWAEFFQPIFFARLAFTIFSSARFDSPQLTQQGPR